MGLDLAHARANMVDGQIRTNKVIDQKLLTAFEAIPREEFVPPAAKSLAYLDEDIRLSKDRYMLEPMVLARLIQALEIQPEHTVLDVGCGYGYSAAIMASLARMVFALEQEPELAQIAGNKLPQYGIDNSVVIEAPLTEGYTKGAPYNAILINGAVQTIPETLWRQLEFGGVLATVYRDAQKSTAMLYKRVEDSLSAQPLFDAFVPNLADFNQPPGFNF